MSRFKVAVCQLDTQNNKENNLTAIGHMIDTNARNGADLIAFPETMNYMGHNPNAYAETIPGPTTDFLCQKAIEHNIWIMSGSILESQDETTPKNTLTLIDPNGKICAKYSKLHMFDVDLDDGNSYKESSYNTPGDEIVLIDTKLGRLGFAICYDLRFGEIFRLMALNGAKVVFLPASFTYKTGKDHWETLLRARAIENGVYIIAPNQIGCKTSMTAYGHSMIIDPWGNILAECSDKSESIIAEINTSVSDTVQEQIPCLKNRRTDIYDTSSSAISIYYHSN